MSDTTPSAPPAAAGELAPEEQTVPPQPVAFIVTCQFCGQRHQYPAGAVEPVTMPTGT